MFVVTKKQHDHQPNNHRYQPVELFKWKRAHFGLVVVECIKIQFMDYLLLETMAFYCLQ